MQCLLCEGDVPASHDCPSIHDECWPRLKVAIKELTDLQAEVGILKVRLSVVPDKLRLIPGLEGEVKRLREAGLQLLRCSLPPRDVSGTRMFNEAAGVFRNA